MIYSPRTLMNIGVLSGGIDEECLQPCGVDLRLDSLFRVSSAEGNIMRIGKQGVDHLPTYEVFPFISDVLVYQLSAGAYQFWSPVYVKLQENMAGWVIARSSLNRNGLRVWSGLYDPGFRNYIGGTLYVPPYTRVDIEKGARIAQFIVVTTEDVWGYEGQYQDSKEKAVASEEEKEDVGGTS